ncbi:MAG: NAD(P)/FAD-dependent oxidoreductase [Gammaproteobacteria bacterium]|nr:NAD(P)/FAD-dependent oxidoreductase [Gammaproteobacteria bacterium]
MCAFIAGRRGRRVLVLEGSNKIGKKILMSGGGRCNFTNLHSSPANFLSANPRFCISALSRYTPGDFIALVEKHAIQYHEKTLGQLFCNESSKQILGLLAAECETAAVEIRTQSNVSNIKSIESFEVVVDGNIVAAPSLVIATGGLSIPKMGASDFGYRVARQFGHKVLATRAGLVPFTFTGDIHDRLQRLSGVSVPSVVEANGVTFAEDLLFTHRGLSGPAVLQASSYWRPGDDIAINLLPDTEARSLLLDAKASQGDTRLRTILANCLPRALALELQASLWPEQAEKPIRDLRNETLVEIAATLHAWRLKPAATEGYRTAEVTLGGVDTTELSSKTMASKLQPGLFFIGEVVDVTGHLGGHNFQWAWASGHAAGTVV